MCGELHRNICLGHGTDWIVVQNLFDWVDRRAPPGQSISRKAPGLLVTFVFARLSLSISRWNVTILRLFYRQHHPSWVFLIVRP
jgi:hypothetical protein